MIQSYFTSFHWDHIYIIKSFIFFSDSLLNIKSGYNRDLETITVHILPAKVAGESD